MAVRFPDKTQPLEPLFDHLTPVGGRGFLPGEMLSPRGVAIDPYTDHIYIAEACRLSIFSANGKFLKTFEHEQMKVPWGIAIHQESIYVTEISKHSILHFKLQEDIRLVARLGGRGSGVGQFNAPRQLAVSSVGTVFVADRGNHRVKVLDSDIVYRRHISHLSLTHPCDVKLTADEVYVLSDSDSVCLHVFSHSGDKTRSLVTRGGNGMQVSIPTFFCLDNYGNLFISDCHRNEIKTFSKEGKLLHLLGERGHDIGMFYQPRGVALTTKFQLVIVSQNENYGLQIFSKH